jgi:hypothetical protein
MEGQIQSFLKEYRAKWQVKFHSQTIGMLIHFSCPVFDSKVGLLTHAQYIAVVYNCSRWSKEYQLLVELKDRIGKALSSSEPIGQNKIIYAPF